MVKFLQKKTHKIYSHNTIEIYFSFKKFYFGRISGTQISYSFAHALGNFPHQLACSYVNIISVLQTVKNEKNEEQCKQFFLRS